MKKSALLFLTISLLIVGISKAQDKSNSAEIAIKNKDYSAALTIAKGIIDSGSTDDGLKLLIQLRELGINDKKLYEYLGDAYSKMKVFELAYSNYEEAEKIDSLDISIKFKTADILYKEKRYTDAVNKYLKIIAIDQNNSKAYFNAAQILYQAKLYFDAALMYEKYIAIEQTSDAYEKITKSFIETRDFEKALQYADEGLKKYPGNGILERNAAIAAFELRKFGVASKYYSALPDSLMNTNDLVNAARSFQQIKSDSAALKYFEKAVNKDSTLSSIYMDLADYNYLNKNYDTAVKYYRAKIKSDSTYEPAYRFMAFALMQEQKYDETRQALLKATQLNDTLVTSRFWLAQTYRQLDSLNAAAEQYEKMLQVIGNREPQYKNECAEAYGFLGQRAFEKKNYIGAINDFKKAIAFKGDILSYKVMLASAYHQNGNYDEAIVWYKKVLALDPKNEVAKKGLRMLSAD